MNDKNEEVNAELKELLHINYRAYTDALSLGINPQRLTQSEIMKFKMMLKDYNEILYISICANGKYSEIK
jgi:hypothetical protein